MPWPVTPGWDPLSAAAVSSPPFGALRAADERFTEVCDRAAHRSPPGTQEDPDRQAAR